MLYYTVVSILESSLSLATFLLIFYSKHMARIKRLCAGVCVCVCLPQFVINFREGKRDWNGCFWGVTDFAFSFGRNT